MVDQLNVSMDGYLKVYGSNYQTSDDSNIYPTVRLGIINNPMLIIMVGLPARGKTFIAKKLCRYLNWIGIGSRVFNLGQYRRSVVGADQKHVFFDPANMEANKIRNSCAFDALSDIQSWFKNKKHIIAILDGTNSTTERRNFLCDFCKERKLKVFFVESYCDDSNIIEDNIKQVKLFSPDYINMKREEAFEDFMKRIEHYKTVYSSLDFNIDKDISFIKIFNAGTHFYINKIDGYVQSRVVYFLTNIHIKKRSIYLVLHGKCHISSNKQSNDSFLSEEGIEFSIKLGEYFKSNDIRNMKIWCSTINSTIETAKYMDIGSWTSWKVLDGIKYGDFHGLTPEEIHQKSFGQCTADGSPSSFSWSYPSGESYKDLVSRLEPVIMEMERQTNVLIICHKTVMKSLLAYFLEHNSDELPFEKVCQKYLI